MTKNSGSVQQEFPYSETVRTNKIRRKRVIKRLCTILTAVVSLGVFTATSIWVTISISKPLRNNVIMPESIPGVHNEINSDMVALEMKFGNIWEAKPVLAEKKLIALTFDDGPSEYTSRLLDILKSKGVRATFFVLGRNASNFPDIIRRERAEGHEVESHTMNHVNLATLSASAIEGEVTMAEDVICGTLNQSHCIKYIRPPYGSLNSAARNVIRQPLMGWGIDSLDWKLRNSEQIREEIKKNIFDGGVILMHDVYDTTVDAVGLIIDGLIADGYTFVTVDEMVKERDPELSTGILYGIFKP